MFAKLLVAVFVVLVVIATLTYGRQLPSALEFLPEDAISAAVDLPKSAKGWVKYSA